MPGRDSNPRTLRSHDPKEPLPAQQADQEMSRPGDQAMEDTGALPVELRPGVVRAAGLEPATTRLALAVEGTPVCASGRLETSRSGTTALASWIGCEATVRTRTSWFRARRRTSSTTSQWSGRRDSNSQPPASDAGAPAVAPRPDGYSRRGSNPHWQGSRPCASTGVGLREQVGTDGRIRTDTGGGLSTVPLPQLGYVSRVDRAGVEPSRDARPVR